MPTVTPESWRSLPDQSSTYAELAAEAVAGADGTFLATDHDGARHLLLVVDADEDIVNDEHSRGIRAVTRPLSVQGQPERRFIDVLCAVGTGQDVFNLAVTAILDQVAQGGHPSDAVRSTLARWRRFWDAAPESGLTNQEIRGLFGELWFLAFWLMPHGHDQVNHWLGPTGARHDFQWPALAIEAKATTSVRGHVHRINGLDQLEPPVDGRLSVFSLRLREEPSAANSLVTLVERITSILGDQNETLDVFETRLAQIGYSSLERDRYAELRFRVVSERLYEVTEEFPRLCAASFVNGLPAGVERVEYEVNLEGSAALVAAERPDELTLTGS